MKNKNILIIIGAIVAVAVILVIYFITKEKPLKEVVIPERAPFKIEPPKPVERPPVKKIAEKPEVKPPAPVVEEEAPEEAEEAEEAVEPEAWPVAYLRAEPSEVEMEVDEGGRSKSGFTLTNEGPGQAMINIYKVDGLDTPAAISQSMERLLERKLSQLPETPTKQSLSKTGLFTGAPWLIQFPYYDVLEAGESREIKLTAVATNLESGEHKTNLIVLGLHKEGAIAVPVYLTVIGSPKLRYGRIEVDDGFSVDTTGNRNRCVNPGEKAAFTIYLDNRGSSDGEDLTLKLTSDDSSVTILEDEVHVDFVEAGGQLQARFVIEVSNEAHPTIPPTVILTTTDSEGRKWFENFYIGEPGTFEYPGGLLIEEEPEEPIKKE